MAKFQHQLKAALIVITMGGGILPAFADEEIQLDLTLSPSEFYKQGVGLNKLGMAEQARRLLTAGIKLEPKGPQVATIKRYLTDYVPRYPVPVEAQVRNAQGQRLERVKKTEEAVQTFEKCIDEHPFFECPYTNLSEIFYDQKNYAKSAKYARDALAINQNYVPGWLRLGKALEKTGDASGARQAFTRASQLDPACEEAKEGLKGVSK